MVRQRRGIIAHDCNRRVSCRDSEQVFSTWRVATLRSANCASLSSQKTVETGKTRSTLATILSRTVREAVKLEPEYLRMHSVAIQMGCKRFEIYCLRHSALTMLAESGCDAFTLARIAGHSSITITQRYCHPQADAIERAFGKLSGGHKIGHNSELPPLDDDVQEAGGASVTFTL
jgi:hypothetical protein